MKIRLLLFSILVYTASCSDDHHTAGDAQDPTPSQSIEIKVEAPVEGKEKVVLTQGSITLKEIDQRRSSEASLELLPMEYSEGKNELKFVQSGAFNLVYLANNHLLISSKDPKVEAAFMDGNNVFLAFLTDTNGVSIKSDRTCVLRNVVLGNNEALFDVQQPHLFYYLPKQEAEQSVILDFFLVNTGLSKTGNKVKVSINDTIFMLDKWAAYEVIGLSGKNNKIRLQLVDNEGNLVEGPFNDSGDRYFDAR